MKMSDKAFLAMDHAQQLGADRFELLNLGDGGWGMLIGPSNV